MDYPMPPELPIVQWPWGICVCSPARRKIVMSCWLAFNGPYIHNKALSTPRCQVHSWHVLLYIYVSTSIMANPLILVHAGFLHPTIDSVRTGNETVGASTGTSRRSGVQRTTRFFSFSHPPLFSVWHSLELFTILATRRASVLVTWTWSAQCSVVVCQ